MQTIISLSYLKNTFTLGERTNAANKASTKCQPSKQIFFCCKFIIDALDERFKLLCNFLNIIINIRQINIIKSCLQMS